MRVVVARAERFHRRESGHADGDDRRLGAAGEKYIRVAKLDHAPRFTNGIVRSGARGDDAKVRPLQSEFHGNQAAPHVADQHRDGEGGNARGTFGEQDGVLILQSFQAADAAAHDRAEAGAVDFLHIHAAVGHRHFRRRHGQLRKTVRSPGVLRILEKIFWLEVANFAADLAIVVRGIEGLDPLNAADAVFEIAPKSLDIVADRRDRAEARDNDSAIFHQREPIPTLCTVWNSLPSVLMEGAMMISVC